MVKEVLNPLAFFAEFHNLAFKTLAVYKCALRLPLLFGLGLNLDGELVRFFWGAFLIKSPSYSCVFAFLGSFGSSPLRSDLFPLGSILGIGLPRSLFTFSFWVQEGRLVKSQPWPEIPIKEVINLSEMGDGFQS